MEYFNNLREENQDSLTYRFDDIMQKSERRKSAVLNMKQYII